MPIELDGLAVGLMTCYDLRFPELARALVDAGAEVLVVPGGVGAPGRARSTTGARWSRARAIENTAYVVAVGQPAPRYTGHSMVVDPLGDVLVEAGANAGGAHGGARRGRSSEAPPDQPLAGQSPT